MSEGWVAESDSNLETNCNWEPPPMVNMMSKQAPLTKLTPIP